MTVHLAYYFFAYLAVALILCLALAPVAAQVAMKFGAVDRGAGRRVHRGVVPRLGGLAIFAGFVVPLLFALTRGAWGEERHKLTGILVASAVVLLVGVWDDLKGATVRNKLLAEVVAAVIIWGWGVRIEVLSNPFGQALRLGWWSLPVTVLWVVVITNALNLVDGLDGLAAGTGILIAGTLFLLAGDRDLHLKVTLVILIGSLLGFLKHNFPPASIFMGDSGSLFVGFFLAGISVMASFKATAMATMMVAIIAFGHPLMDMTYAVLRRLYRGVPLGRPDREHIHHKLVEMGMSHRRAVLTLYAFNLALMAVVLLFLRKGLQFSLAGLFLLAGAAVAGLKVFGYVEFLPFFREAQRNLAVSRQRRYCNYLIRRFRGSARQAATVQELRGHLDSLAREYDFDRFEVLLDNEETGANFYSFRSDRTGGDFITLDFPVLNRGRRLGKVVISKSISQGHVLAIAELARALSDGIASFLARRGSGHSP